MTLQRQSYSFRPSPFRSGAGAPSLVERVEQRLLFAAGDLDGSFGAGGIALVPEVRSGGTVVATSARVYHAGTRSAPGADTGTLLITAFTGAGRPDASWAADGTLDTGIDSRFQPALVTQTDGKVVALAVPTVDGSGSTLARFNTDGSPDASFGANGRVALPFGKELALGPDGKIVVAGSSASSYAVARFNADGTPDATFGGDGNVVVTSGIPDHFVGTPFDMAVLPDGDVVLVGRVDAPIDGTGWDGFVAKLNADGSPDATFDGDGRLILDFGWVDDEITAVTAAAGGKFFIATSEGEVEGRPVLLNSDGSEDLSFHAPKYQAPELRIASMHLTQEGKLIVSGSHTGRGLDGPYTFMHRYNPDGTIDGTFGGYRFHRPIGAQTDLTPDGGIVAAGSSAGTAAVARYLTTGGTSTTVIQAEYGRLQGAQARRDHRGYTGTGYVDFIGNTGDAATWTVAAQTTGVHSLTFRYANGSATPRVMRLTVDGPSHFLERDVWFNPSGSWSRWRTMTVHLPLRAAGFDVGLNDVRLTAIGNNGPNVDSLTVRRPTPRPRVPGVVEAEDGRLGGEAFVSSLNAGYTGRGYVDFTRTTGDLAEWLFDSDFAAAARMRILYANGAAANRSLRLTVNGQVVNSNLSFAPTGSWSNWRVLEVSVPLRVGDNTLRLDTNGSHGPNIDRIETRF